MGEIGKGLEKFVRSFYKKKSPELQITSFNKELFTNPEVTIDQNPLPLTRVPEIGLYNGLLNWIDKKVASYFSIAKKFGATKSEEWGSRLMTDEKNIVNKAPIQVENQADALRVDFMRNREIIELRKIGQEVEPSDGYSTKAAEIVRNLEAIDYNGDQYIRNERSIRVKFDGIGELTSRIVEINPLKMIPREGVELGRIHRDDPLICYLGGWGNDPRSEAPMLQEIALNGLDVVGIGYVDSQTGIPNEKFAEQVEASTGLEAHAEHMKAVVRELIKRNSGRKVQLWGQSTGALVWATALSDSEFAKVIDGAVFIQPAGAVDIENQASEYISESLTLAKRIKRAPLYSFVSGIKDRTGLPRDEKDIKNVANLRGRIWEQVTRRTNKRSSTYDTAHTANDKNKYFYIGGKDTTTRGFDRFNDSFENGKIIFDPEGLHQDSNTLPDTVVKKIIDAQK